MTFNLEAYNESVSRAIKDAGRAISSNYENLPADRDLDSRTNFFRPLVFPFCSIKNTIRTVLNRKTKNRFAMLAGKYRGDFI